MSGLKVALVPEEDKQRGSSYGSFAASQPGTAEVEVKVEEFQAVSFHDVAYSVRTLITRKTKKILNGVR